MDARALVALFALCAVLAVSEGIKCYKCTRLEWTVFSDGEDSDKCEFPEDKEAPTEDDCEACARDTRDEDFDWVGRHCIKDATKCTNGTFEQEHPAFDWINKIPFFDNNPKFDTERGCCKEDLCNSEPFDTDAAVAIQLTSGLVFAVLISLFYNFRQ